MKYLLKVVSFILLLTVNYTGNAQQIVQKSNDAKQLEIYAKKFIGKPLKELLKEIKPKIKMVSGRPGWAEEASIIQFYFVTHREYNKYAAQNKTPTCIKVYLKETFDWNRNFKNEDEYFSWTLEDEVKYGNLTIAAITVYGEDSLYDDSPVTVFR